MSSGMRGRIVDERRGMGGSGRRPERDPFAALPADAGPRLATRRGGIACLRLEKDAAHSQMPAARRSQKQASQKQINQKPAGQKQVGQKQAGQKQTGKPAVLGATPHNLICIALAGSEDEERAAGALFIVPAREEGGQGPGQPPLLSPPLPPPVPPFGGEIVAVVLPQASLCELAGHDGMGGEITLQPVAAGTVDPFALRVARLMKAELVRAQESAEAANVLYMEGLLTVLGVHLLRNHAGVKKTPAKVSGGLSARHAQTLRDYLDANRAAKLSVAALAAEIGLSPHYFVQAFARTFGKPPHRYIIDLRLDMAMNLLAHDDLSIMEIAHQTGFSSQAHLTTTMKKYRNSTPMQVRRGR